MSSNSKDFFTLGIMAKHSVPGSPEGDMVKQLYVAAKDKFMNEVIALNTKKDEPAEDESQKPVEVIALEYVAGLFHALDTLQIDVKEPNHDAMCIQRSLFFNIIKDAVINSLNAKAKPDEKDEGKPPEE